MGRKLLFTISILLAIFPSFALGDETASSKESEDIEGTKSLFKIPKAMGAVIEGITQRSEQVQGNQVQSVGYAPQPVMGASQQPQYVQGQQPQNAMYMQQPQTAQQYPYVQQPQYMQQPQNIMNGGAQQAQNYMYQPQSYGNAPMPQPQYMPQQSAPYAPYGQVRFWQGSQIPNTGSSKKVVDFEISKLGIHPAMAYTRSLRTFFKVPSLSQNSDDAIDVLKNYVHYAIENALEKQLSHDKPSGKNSNIGYVLKQVNVEIDYQPLQCHVAFANASYDKDLIDPTAEDGSTACIVAGDKIVTLCSCSSKKFCCNLENKKNIKKIASQYEKFSGKIRTKHSVFEDWPQEKWESVLKRALLMLKNGIYHRSFTLATMG
ncbi:hypothetical protein Y032_0542g3214 [Ancylostoma ceylanicum]|uniref:Uncharacterized protein n=1 Tax=Ancylostoma ceylanicum TaxID=53326 RepID=A0A016WRA1_9BILA|nr:hypothetical protein Y032_0542g3214 [Ancylostoma ceylanicum]